MHYKSLSRFAKKSVIRPRVNEHLIALVLLCLNAMPASLAQPPLPGVPVTHPVSAAPKAPIFFSSSAPKPAAAPPTASSLVTPAVAANLAKIVNAPQTVINVANLANGVYNFTGNFINTSNLVFVSTNTNVHTVTLSVTGSIFNPVGASISTMAPTGYANAVSNLSLSLDALGGIYNAGSITAAGSLSPTAPVIANIHPNTIGATGPAPIMQATTGDVSMHATTVLNQGTIASTVGNIHLDALAGTNSLAINSLGGNFSAVNGAINIGTQNLTNKLNLQIFGGDYISQTLNVAAGSAGLVSLQANSVSGLLNITAGSAFTNVDTGTLKLGNLNVGGDPYVSVGGNIIFSGVTNVSDVLEVTATGSILSDGTATSIYAQNGIDMYNR